MIWMVSRELSLLFLFHFNVHKLHSFVFLTDLGGEIVLLDWGEDGIPEVSLPNRHLPSFTLMKNGTVNLVRIYEGKKETDQLLHHQMTLLDPKDHEFMKALPKDNKDPIAVDIKDIPRICRNIQDDWRGFGTGTSLNRLTAWNFTKCLQKRMQSLHSQSVQRQSGTVDILLTGCEVSLWLAGKLFVKVYTDVPNHSS